MENGKRYNSLLGKPNSPNRSVKPSTKKQPVRATALHSVDRFHEFRFHEPRCSSRLFAVRLDTTPARFLLPAAPGYPFQAKKHASLIKSAHLLAVAALEGVLFSRHQPLVRFLCTGRGATQGNIKSDASCVRRVHIKTANERKQEPPCWAPAIHSGRRPF